MYEYLVVLQAASQEQLEAKALGRIVMELLSTGIGKAREVTEEDPNNDLAQTAADLKVRWPKVLFGKTRRVLEEALERLAFDIAEGDQDLRNVTEQDIDKIKDLLGLSDLAWSDEEEELSDDDQSQQLPDEG